MNTGSEFSRAEALLGCENKVNPERTGKVERMSALPLRFVNVNVFG